MLILKSSLARLRRARLLPALVVFAALSILALPLTINAQDAAAPQASAPQSAAPMPVTPAPAAPAATADTLPQPAAPAPQAASAFTEAPGNITEDQLRKQLVGKELFLRGGYLDSALSFNEHGVLIGHSPQGSYTLSGIEIERVHLSKHKVELEGARYGLHFLGALPSEDPTKAVDRVRITPNKKVVKISIDRELVLKPKQKKEKEKGKGKSSRAKAGSPAPAAAEAANEASTPEGDANEAQAEIAAAKPEERPADPKSITTTTSPAHAKQVLLEALGNIFAEPFDARMMQTMPGFWKLYYEAVAEKSDYRPKDPAVLRQSMADQKARLTSTFEPGSNQFAQDNGVAGMALYHVVIGADGKPSEIAVARPIGFGLDESAVASIGKATFQPAMKDGRPVPVLLDLVVQFRIYSKRTDTTAAAENSAEKSAPVLPGPYSAEHQ